MLSSEDTVLPDTWKMNFPTLPFRWGEIVKSGVLFSEPYKPFKRTQLYG